MLYGLMNENPVNNFIVLEQWNARWSDSYEDWIFWTGPLYLPEIWESSYMVNLLKMWLIFSSFIIAHARDFLASYLILSNNIILSEVSAQSFKFLTYS